MGWPKTGWREAARGCPWRGGCFQASRAPRRAAQATGETCAWEPGPPLHGTFLPCGGDYFSAVGHRIGLGTARTHAHVQSPRPDMTRIHSGVLGASHLPRDVPAPALSSGQSHQLDGQATSALAPGIWCVQNQGRWHRTGRVVLEPGHSVG